MQVHRRPYRAALRAATAVVGVGTTEFGNLTGSSADDLGLAALEAALDDAGLTARDLDGLIVNRVSSYETVASRMGIEPRWTAQLPAEGRMTGIAIQMAVLAITTGMASTIALVYGNNGRSGGHTYGGGGASASAAAEGYGTNPALTLPYGMTSPGAFYAMMFQRHCAQYGTTAEQLAQVAVTLRDHASLNPYAVFKDPISREIYLESRFIVEPLKIYDYCLINDGGVAMILTSADRARDCAQPPVHVLGFGQQGQLRNSDFPPDDFWREAIATAGKQAYTMADCSRADVDVLMAYDNFSPNVLFTLEGLGFCAPGESGAWIQDGRIGLRGELPINTSGGHLSESYMQGWGLNVEAVRQLRRTCGDRQVQDATIAQYLCAAPVVTSVVYGAQA
ncbi:thiolase family protein [Rhodococcus opacus]|uniref:thiolase family protein n=1 Tax=Rhodococcus opacus TaxID=37919 RepID=UPI001F53E47B|nr:thiolase family protein [Rhodococcus opacus]